MDRRQGWTGDRVGQETGLDRGQGWTGDRTGQGYRVQQGYRVGQQEFSMLCAVSGLDRGQTGQETGVDSTDQQGFSILCPVSLCPVSLCPVSLCPVSLCPVSLCPVSCITVSCITVSCLRPGHHHECFSLTACTSSLALFLSHSLSLSLSLKMQSCLTNMTV